MCAFCLSDTRICTYACGNQVLARHRPGCAMLMTRNDHPTPRKTIRPDEPLALPPLSQESSSCQATRPPGSRTARSSPPKSAIGDAGRTIRRLGSTGRVVDSRDLAYLGVTVVAIPRPRRSTAGAKSNEDTASVDWSRSVWASNDASRHSRVVTG